jgi:hypothetical protein
LSQTEETTMALDHVGRKRTAAERFAHLSDKLSRSLPHPVKAETAEPVTAPEYDETAQDTAWYEVVPRFPIVKSGYDPGAVDAHIAGLEDELDELEQAFDELRLRGPGHDEVEAELKRIGEQTSGILLAAHERARETQRQAQEQADRCLSDAAARALEITEEASRKREVIERETRQLSDQRTRLLADMEALAGTIANVARQASERVSQ